MIFGSKWRTVSTIMFRSSWERDEMARIFPTTWDPLFASDRTSMRVESFGEVKTAEIMVELAAGSAVWVITGTNPSALLMLHLGSERTPKHSEGSELVRAEMGDVRGEAVCEKAVSSRQVRLVHQPGQEKCTIGVRSEWDRVEDDPACNTFLPYDQQERVTDPMGSLSGRGWHADFRDTSAYISLRSGSVQYPTSGRSSHQRRSR